MAAEPGSIGTPAALARPRAGGLGASVRRLYLPTVLVAGLAAWLSWLGWEVLAQYGPLHTIWAGQFELAGPVVTGFVLVVFLIEQVRPAQRRPLLARGHLLDMIYMLAHALIVVPLIVLLGAGFSNGLVRIAPWLVMPRISAIPEWCFVAVAVLVIDALDWLGGCGHHPGTSLLRVPPGDHPAEETTT